MRTQLRFQRRELKYYLPEQVYPELMRLISGYMKLDEHLEEAGSSNYVVRSLYLDTDDLKCYYEKLDGVHTRRKFRIRAYGHESSSVFFEIKRRYNNTVVKDRAVGRYEEINEVLDQYGGYCSSQGRSDGEMEVIKSYLFHVPLLQLRPVVLVAYDREAYTGVFDDSVRLTLDRNVRCMPGSGIDLFYSGPDWMLINNLCILELKFNHTLPFLFRRIIRRLELQLEAISKYALSIEKVRQSFYNGYL